MKKLFLPILVVALVASAMGPAAAGTSRRITSQSLDAFWHFKRRVAPSTFMRTTWYVGVFDNGRRGIFSDLYQSVERCRRVPDRGTRCRQVRFRIGVSDLEGQTFRIDDAGLTTGHVDATYMLQAHDRRGRPIGDKVATHIVANLTGRGAVSEDRTQSTSESECRRFSYDSRSSRRRATATGRIGGRSLGATSDASLGTSETVITRERTC